MFFTLLIVTFLLSVAVSFGVVKAFNNPIKTIFERVIKDDVATVW